MEIKLTFPALLQFCAASIIALVTLLAWKRRKLSPASHVMFYLLLAITGWTLTAGMKSAFVYLEWKIFFAKIEYFFMALTVPLLIVFTAKHTNRQEWLTKMMLFVIWIVPITTILLTFTNQWHHLIWTGFVLIPSSYKVYQYLYGSMFWVYIGYVYIGLTLLLVYYMRNYAQSYDPFRKQFGYLILALIFPFTSGILYLFNYAPIPGLDIIPLSFSLTAIALGFGFFKDRYTGVIPVARTQLLEWTLPAT